MSDGVGSYISQILPSSKGAVFKCVFSALRSKSTSTSTTRTIIINAGSDEGLPLPAPIVDAAHHGSMAPGVNSSYYICLSLAKFRPKKQPNSVPMMVMACTVSSVVAATQATLVDASDSSCTWEFLKWTEGQQRLTSFRSNKLAHKMPSLVWFAHWA